MTYIQKHKWITKIPFWYLSSSLRLKVHEYIDEADECRWKIPMKAAMEMCWDYSKGEWKSKREVRRIVRKYKKRWWQK